MTVELDKIVDRYGKPEDSLIGKLPRVTCGNCRQASGKVCSDHRKKKCQECGNYITDAHMHLDYVGHAEVTRILSEIDPEWSWEPNARDADGGPSLRVLNKTVEMWGKLTLHGVTREGVGSVESGKGDTGKELIGDFLRNAGMRFGIALSLWSKSEWDEPEDATPEAPVLSDAMKAKVKRIQTIYSHLSYQGGDRLAHTREILERPDLGSHNELTEAEMDHLIVLLDAEQKAQPAAEPGTTTTYTDDGSESGVKSVVHVTVPAPARGDTAAEPALPLNEPAGASSDETAEVVRAMSKLPAKAKVALRDWCMDQGIPPAAMSMTPDQQRAVLAHIKEPTT